MRDLDKPPGNVPIATALLEVLTASGDAAARARAEKVLEKDSARKRRRADWIDTDLLRESFRAAGASPQLARRVGRALVSPQAIGLLLSYTGIATPEKAYRRIDGLLAREEQGGRFRAAEIHEGKARIEFHPPSTSPQDAIFCSVRLGMLEAMTRLYGLLPARAKELSCAHLGASTCVYEVSWRRTPRTGFLLGSLAGAVVGGAAGIGLSVLAGLAGGWAVALAMLVSLTGAACGRSVDLVRQLGAVARGGLGQLALLDQADGVLAEKMDVLAKLDSAAVHPAVERSLGSAPLRSDEAGSPTIGMARRLHRPVVALQKALDELRTLTAKGVEADDSEARSLLGECVAASRDIHSLGAEMAADEDGGPVLEDADLASIVRRGIAAVAPSQPNSLAIYMDIEREPAIVRCQPFQLEQVVIQLMMNAADASHGEGKVEVELRTCPEGYEVAISDSGDGIDPELLDNLFDPFFDNPTASDSELGLTICFRIVNEHGGELSVHSELGRGTRVAVVLPAA